MKLTQDIKDAWIENLRSGEIEQHRCGWDNKDRSKYIIGQPTIKSCCLDVLSLQLTGQHFLDINKAVSNRQDLFTPESQLLRDIGFGFDITGLTEPTATVNDLIELNDEEDYTFEQIADWIEENVEVVDDAAGD